MISKTNNRFFSWLTLKPSLWALFFLFLFFIVTFLVTQTAWVSQFDKSLYWALAKPNRYWFWLHQIISFLGSASVIFTLGGLIFVYLLTKGRPLTAIWYFLSVALGLQLNAAIKVFISRTRPYEYLSHLQLPTYAYPSGHMMGSVVFYFTTCLLLQELRQRPFSKKTKILVGVLVLLIGASRVFTGVHWFFDVIGGLFLGLFWAFINLEVFTLFKLSPQHHEISSARF